MQQAPAPARWLAPATERFGWRQWDDDCVVYDAATADTHLLSGDAGAVFVALLRAPSARTPAELLRALSGEVDGAAQDAAAELATLLEILTGLERIGLACRAAT
ncbi:MAG: HPr-rel-A system PqqD family peptide chaperone [Proteobacteria bacterium]|nr:HPr-rel-A system PqqD family peptide chaperone [Pseudomonadota bacterium]